MTLTLVKLQPDNSRFQHAMLNVADPLDLPRHPVSWSLDDDMYFLTSFVSAGFEKTFEKLDFVVKGKTWASDPTIEEDATGKSEWWKERAHFMTPPTYNLARAEDLGRFWRNKLVHFNQSDPKLKKLFHDLKKQGSQERFARFLQHVGK